MKISFHIMLLSLIMFGCDSSKTSRDSVLDPSEDISLHLDEQEEQTTEIEESSSRISDSLDLIDDSADTILWEMAKIPDDEMRSEDQISEQEADNIREYVKQAQLEKIRIEEALEDLKLANQRSRKSLPEIEELEKIAIEAQKSEREYRQQAIQNMRGFVSLAFSIGFLMVLGGAFVALKIDAKLGMTVLGVGILAVGFAAASQYYLEEIAIIGLVALVIGFIIVVFLLSGTLMKGKQYEEAIREVVELIEEIKDHMSQSNLDEMRKEIFGPNGFAIRFTNPITKKIIAEVKAKNHFDKLSRKQNNR